MTDNSSSRFNFRNENYTGSQLSETSKDFALAIQGNINTTFGHLEYLKFWGNVSLLLHRTTM